MDNNFDIENVKTVTKRTVKAKGDKIVNSFPAHFD